MKTNKDLIQQLANGGLILKHDGTLEELKQVLKEAFPEDITPIEGLGKYYYLGSIRRKIWTCSDTHIPPNISVLSIKDFFIQELPSKWFIEPTKGTVLEICKWFDENHSAINPNTYQNGLCLDFCYTNAFETGNSLHSKHTLIKAGIPEITIEQFREITNTNSNKEIVGYKLIKPEYKEAVRKIITNKQWFKDCFDSNLNNLGYNFGTSNHKGSVKALIEKAGVLDLWFEPVYEEKPQFKKGDLVVGWHYNEGERCFKVWKISKIVLRNNVTYAHPENTTDNTNIVNLRHATPEEIEEYNRPKLPTIGNYDGVIIKDSIIKYGCVEIEIKYFKETFTALSIESMVLEVDNNFYSIDVKQIDQIFKVIETLD